ncbi:condensation domain-containing protein [Streptomyces sp. NPDC058231]|uniref:condensation domain-containing protein n=1 Tax=Streptomyces sp. NPDC058231 TaxID=3346392 RepID=UPI0036ED1454
MADDHPVSPAQKRLWTLDRLHPGSPVYVVPLIYRVDGDLNVPVLERSLSEVVRRHNVLRTVFRVRSRAPRQVVLPPEPVRIPVVDVAGHLDPQAEAERLAVAEARRPFDLNAHPMIRPLLVRLAPDRHQLFLTLHHIACDGWSLHILESELSTCYRSWLAGKEPELPPMAEQYTDFTEWQAARLESPTLHRASEYWRKRLADAPASATIPADHPRPAVQSFDGSHVRFDIEPSVAERVGLLARACGATPFAVLLAAFATLIRARSGAAEAVIGTPVTYRQRESHHRMIGMFVNTVVQRLAVPETATFRELVHRARDESRSAMTHQALPFEMLVEELNPVRDPAFNPVFQLMLSYQEGELAGLALPGCKVGMVHGDTSTAKVDLSLSVTRAGGRYRGRLEYSSDLFDPATAHCIEEQFRTLLASATSDPLRSIGSLLPPD